MASAYRAAGTQFCPRCVGALERLLPVEPEEPIETPSELAAES
ncbi:MAG TPA: hypothetical protein VF101_12020 [Gaiellaceae bacterium]